MDQDDADCGSLIKQTAEVLDNVVLQQSLFQQTNFKLELCMKHAVER
jgi:hypothetical protein